MLHLPESRRRAPCGAGLARERLGAGVRTSDGDDRFQGDEGGPPSPSLNLTVVPPKRFGMIWTRHPRSSEASFGSRRLEPDRASDLLGWHDRSQGLDAGRPDLLRTRGAVGCLYFSSWPPCEMGWAGPNLDSSGLVSWKHGLSYALDSRKPGRRPLGGRRRTPWTSESSTIEHVF